MSESMLNETTKNKISTKRRRILGGNQREEWFKPRMCWKIIHTTYNAANFGVSRRGEQVIRENYEGRIEQRWQVQSSQYWAESLTNSTSDFP